MKMQDKEVLEQADEALKSVSDFSDKKDAKELMKERQDSGEDLGKKEQTKDGKFAFRKMKQPKKERSEKKKLTRFENEGVSFKAKLIGVESVPDARGDKMCQETMQRLKSNVRNLGPHKRKISVSVSFQGIKVKDEKTGEFIYHHPVAAISFISQDITDARAFGYVAGAGSGQHLFIAIKTEKPAFNVVVALRDLFQTVLNLKQEKMELVKEKTVDDADAASSVGSDSINEKTSVHDNVTDSVSSVSEEEKSIKGENIYFDVILTEPFQLKEEVQCTKTVDELLGLQDELNKLQQGIEQMDTSIAAAASNLGIASAEKDPFDTSFVTPGGTKIDAFVQPMPIPITNPSVVPTQSQIPTSQTLYEDKYAAFSTLHNEPSIFEGKLNKEFDSGDHEDSIIPELRELEEEIKKKSAIPPTKPPRNVKTPTTDPSVFADLDPLGKDRPYKDKAEFFQDVKNPPKKVLNDLVDKSNGDEFSCRAFENQCGSPTYPASPPSLASSSYPNGGLASSLPNSFLGNLKFSVASPQNAGLSIFNPFENDTPTQTFNNVNGYHIPPHQTTILSQNSMSSSPIPIPSRQNIENQQRTYSNGSFGSPCSTDYGSPSQLGHNGIDVETHNNSSTLTNGLHDDKTNGIVNPTLYTNGHTTQNPPNPKQNGVSRPRPRPSISNKGNSLPNNGLALSTHPPPIPPPESDGISRGNMQSIAHVLKMNGYARNRAVSMPADNKRDCTVNGNIFTSKPDPFADDFFYSLPKKVANHLTKTEIKDCV